LGGAGPSGGSGTVGGNIVGGRGTVGGRGHCAVEVGQLFWARGGVG
jgi:hypothetical protein